MIKKIKLLILSMSSLFIIATPALVAGTAMAYSQADINACVAQGSNFVFDANSGTCTNTNVDDSNNLNNLIAKVINILSVVVGIVAVVMIIDTTATMPAR